MAQVLTSYRFIEEKNISSEAFEDAFRGMVEDLPTEQTQTFKSAMTSYAWNVGRMTGGFGDGSEEAYEAWKKGLEQKNQLYRSQARENFIKHIVADSFTLFLSAVNSGIVEDLGLIGTVEFSGNSQTFDVDEYEVDDSLDYSYSNLFDYSDEIAGTEAFPDDKTLTEKAKKLGADGVFKIRNYYQIVRYRDEDITFVDESYKPGYYAFKLNEEAFEAFLDEHGTKFGDEYGSAAAFKAEYDNILNTIKKKYPSGRYFIRDGSGTVFTNVDSLGAKSTQKDIEKAFGKFGFYCIDSKNEGSLYLPDGEYYCNSYFYDDDEDEGVIYKYGSTVTVMTTQPQTTTVTPVTESTTYKVSVQEPTAPSYKVDAENYDNTPFINESTDNWLCVLGVDYNSEFVDTDLFRNAATRIELAREAAGEALIGIGSMLFVLIICLIWLMASAGRRSFDKEYHLLKSDMIFVDWRIAIDTAAGWALANLFFLIADYFDGVLTQPLVAAASLLAAGFTAVVIDLLTFIAKHIKARTLFKRIFLVWIIVKGIHYFKNKLTPVIKEKLLYTKHFSKGTIIRLSLVAGVNIIIGFFGSIEILSNETSLLFVLLFLFDVFAFVWLLRLIGGLNKIFSSLEEIRQGNYDVYINLNSLPSTLRESAQRVMSLRDGLKTAVEEAVKQEQTKTELITNVSHDLKTPLTSIINYVELLKKCNISDEDAKEYLDILGEKSDRLKKLIEDLVEASKASTGNIKVDFVEVSLNELVSQLLGEHSDGLEKRRLNVVAEMPEENLVVRADGKLLYRVMENLIVNVEKYSLYGTRVYVTVKEENGYGTVSFKNISEQPLNITVDRLKERFVRGDESRSTEGNGLGLSIAQSLCDVQGGELEIAINGDLFTAKVKLKK